MTRVLLAALVFVAPLSAQPPETRPLAHAARLEGSIRVDGRIDEAAWQAAAPILEFVQQRPRPEEPGTEATEARVLYDDDALYIAMRMHDRSPDSIVARLSRRDQPTTSDYARVYIDSYADRQTAFIFWVNPAGAIVDWIRYGDGAGADISWDAVWDAAASVDEGGWSAEFRIPFSQLRYSADATNRGQTWGLNLSREIARRGETTFWSHIPPNSAAFVSHFGQLAGLRNIASPARLEVVPYITSSATLTDRALRTPLVDGSSAELSGGADVKIGVGSGLTLSATINPDFGQVEADPAEVNLTAFESFFPERRPFFMEGSQIFRFGELNVFNGVESGTSFYSRRIGRAPQGFVNRGGVTAVDAPTSSTILGAAKLTGQASGWSVALMDAITAAEDAEYRLADGTGGRDRVEPFTNYLVARVRRDLDGGRSNFGAMATAVHRDLDGSATLESWLRREAYVAGVDAEHSWHNKRWIVSGFGTLSRVAGSPAAIALTQTSSARYFQRPDAESFALDPDRTSLTGYSVTGAVRYSGAVDGSLAYAEVSPEFELNDVGFLSRSDQRQLAGFLGRRVNRPTRAFQNYQYYLYNRQSWNFDGDLIGNVWGGGMNATFRNFMNTSASVVFYGSPIEDRFTRGGPVAKRPSAFATSLNVGSDYRRTLQAVANVYHARYAHGGEHNTSLGVTLAYRPVPAVAVTVAPSYQRRVTDAQFVRSVADATAAHTFGRRYVFGELDQRTVSMNTRVDWTFRPNLSFQLLARPFLATGDVGEYREFLEPRGYAFATYGSDAGTVSVQPDGSRRIDPDGSGPAAAFVVGDRAGQRDFTSLAVRGNAVLRWEYRPGSTLFLVWQQDRSEYGFETRDDLAGGLLDTFTAPGRNVLMIKLSYWLNR